MRFFMALSALTLFGSALAGPRAVLVVKEWALEKGEIKEYIGTKSYPVGGVGLVEPLIKELSRQPAPARWGYFRDRGWVAIERPGYSINLDLAKAAYMNALASGKSQFVLPTVYTASDRGVAYFYGIGVRELISEATTTFFGSTPERIFNLTLASSKLNGIFIPQGQVFSFAKAVGEISEQAGYKDAFVIVGDKTEKGVGGGLCQVSTTMFRAAYFAGLPILERKPHSYQVGYYRPTGLDAAVFLPWQDLKFKNDTPGHILVLTRVRGHSLTFRFFGTKDRSANWTSPVITNRIPAPPTRYIPTTDLPPGKQKQIDFRADGANVTVVRTVKFADGRVKSDTLASKYKPWAEVYLVGEEPKPESPTTANPQEAGPSGSTAPSTPGEQAPAPPATGD